MGSLFKSPKAPQMPIIDNSAMERREAEDAARASRNLREAEKSRTGLRAASVLGAGSEDEFAALQSKKKTLLGAR